VRNGSSTVIWVIVLIFFAASVRPTLAQGCGSVAGDLYAPGISRSRPVDLNAPSSSGTYCNGFIFDANYGFERHSTQ